ncbi:MAG: RsmE family RNA methyltransferase [Ilumatobacteraceae bacterium]
MTPEGADVLRRAAAHLVVDDVRDVTIDEPQAHHLFRVLRVRDGDVVTVTDGRGAWRRCRAAGASVTADGEVHVEPDPTDPVTIAFAVPKHDRPEWIVQKLTEIGVDRIVLLHAERSVVRWGADRAERHVSKLQRVALEAVQQSRRVRLPTVSGPVPAVDVICAAAAAEPGGRAIVPTDRVIAIGPEGGWTDDELRRAAALVSLGSTVLRVETAAVCAAVRVVHHTEW